jgi:hypothetical protein
LGDGVNELWFAVEVKGVNVDVGVDPENTRTIDYDDTHWPTLNFGYRRGVLDTMDFGVALLSGLNVLYADYKWAFVDGEDFAMALDPGLGVEFAKEAPAQAGFLQLDLPLLIDVVPVDWLTITVAPKYMGVNYFRPLSERFGGRTGYQSWVAGTLLVGVRFSELFELAPYVALAYFVDSPVEQEVILDDLGIAFSFRF